MKKKKKKSAIKKKQRRMKAKQLANQKQIHSHLKIGDTVKHNGHLVLIKEIHAGIAELSDGYGVSIDSLSRVDLDD